MILIENILEMHLSNGGARNCHLGSTDHGVWGTEVPVGPRLTLSPPIPLRFYTLPYWSNPPFF